MARSFSIDELPYHLILEILTSGKLSAADLGRLEATCRVFKGGNEQGVCNSDEFRSVVEFAAFLACEGSEVYGGMPRGARKELVERCGGCWKKVLRFLQAVERSGGTVETSAGYMQSGEVFTCGDNSSFCCGHGEVARAIFRPTCVEALRGIQCKQVATGLSFTAILTSQGHVYTCGSNTHGQLGHGDTTDRPTPRKVESLEGLGNVIQIATGASYSFAVTSDGVVHSFGSCSNFCLGHGDQHDELVPRAIQSFKKRNIHVVRVSAGDEHAVALDSSGHVYTWGRGYCGALGHGDENDKTNPELLNSVKSHLAVQVCARKRKTFVLTDEGSVFAFGWMGFGSLGFSDRGSSDKVMRPRVLESLRTRYVSQISTGLYHTVAVTNKGLVFGFGDNERQQLGQESIRGCLRPTEIMMHRTIGDMAIEAQSG